MMQKHHNLLWAKGYLNWTKAKWKAVLWSDESKFQILFGEQALNILLTKEGREHPP